MNREAFSDLLEIDVSRETFERLNFYHDTLIKWSKTHNLIGPREREQIWTRHFADCLQLVPMIDPDAKLVDIGSGAGFPGLVIACAQADNFRPAITLVEPNLKRCAFLRHVSHSLSLNVEVMNDRIENVSRETFDVVTSRAVSSLTKLLEMGAPWLENGAKALFLKGHNAEEELTEARHYWNFKVQMKPSRSDSHGVVLSLSEVRIRDV